MAKATARSNGARKAGSGQVVGRRPLNTGYAEMSVTDKIVWWCLHLTIFLVPIAISNFTFIPGVDLPLTYDQFDIVKVVTMRTFALIGIGAWAWGMLTKGGRLRRTKVDWLVLAVLAWVLLTSFTSIHMPTAIFGKYRRFEGLLSFITYAALFFLTVQLVDRPSRIRSLARTVFFSSLVVSGYGLLQFMGLDPLRWGTLPFEANRSFSTFGNPDLLGGYLMFPLPIACALALSEDDRNWRIFYWVGFAINAIVWLTAFVRGAWIGGFIGVVIVGVAVFLAKPKLEPAADGAALGATLLALAAVFIKSLQAPNEVMNVAKRLQSIFQTGEGSAKTRFEIWQAAIDAIKDRPIFGFGADTFRLVFPKYKPYAYVKDGGYLSVADNVHNYPLQITSALGIPGFLLLYGLFGAVLFFTAPLAFVRGSGRDRLLFAGIWAASVAYIVHLFFGLSVTGSTFLLWICFGLLLSATARNVEFPAPRFGLVAIVVALVVAAGVVWQGVYLVADNSYLRARINQQDPTGRIEAAKTANRLNPFNDMYLSEIGLAYKDYMVAAQSQIDQGRTEPQFVSIRDDSFRASSAYLERAIEFVPTEYDNYVFITNLYAQYSIFTRESSYSKTAVEWGLRGIEVEPYGPAVRVQTALSYMSLGQYDMAIELMKETIPMDPAFVEPRNLLARAYQEQGSLAEAKREYEAVLKVDPSNVQAMQALRELASKSPTAAQPATR